VQALIVTMEVAIVAARLSPCLGSLLGLGAGAA
jgi:hypothetical protein